MDGAPDIAAIAALIGDPARASILMALMGGRALTATELALEADVSPSTASSHLAKLRDAELITLQRQGRHRYFQIADPAVAEVIERLCGIAERRAGKCAQPGPADPALRKARVCYDHLAGELAVALFEGLIAQRLLGLRGDGISITKRGAGVFAQAGINVDELDRLRRPTCRQCLDWSVRRHHLAGALGAAILEVIYARRWAERDLTSRAVHFSPAGERKLRHAFHLPA